MPVRPALPFSPGSTLLHPPWNALKWGKSKSLYSPGPMPNTLRRMGNGKGNENENENLSRILCALSISGRTLLYSSLTTITRAELPQFEESEGNCRIPSRALAGSPSLLFAILRLPDASLAPDWPRETALTRLPSSSMNKPLPYKSVIGQGGL